MEVLGGVLVVLVAAAVVAWLLRRRWVHVATVQVHLRGSGRPEINIEEESLPPQALMALPLLFFAKVYWLLATERHEDRVEFLGLLDHAVEGSWLHSTDTPVYRLPDSPLVSTIHDDPGASYRLLIELHQHRRTKTLYLRNTLPNPSSASSWWHAGFCLLRGVLYALEPRDRLALQASASALQNLLRAPEAQGKDLDTLRFLFRETTSIMVAATTDPSFTAVGGSPNPSLQRTPPG